MERLSDKIVLITGAAQGIGWAIAKECHRQGATVILSDINHEAGLQAANCLGEGAFFFPLDVRSEQQWQAIMQEISVRFERLDVLVNNAGVTGFHLPLGPQNPEDASLESWQSVHETNLTGTFLGCQHGIRMMKMNTSHASIVNISSRSGIVGIPHAAAYASSKAAIRNHTKSVALYCAEKKYPITCNSIHPAAILTPMWEQMLDPHRDRSGQLDKIAAHIPLQRFGQPEEVAYAVVYLASDEARYLTGIELTIDGGILAGAAASPSSD